MTALGFSETSHLPNNIKFKFDVVAFPKHIQLDLVFMLSLKVSFRDVRETVVLFIQITLRSFLLPSDI